MEMTDQYAKTFIHYRSDLRQRTVVQKLNRFFDIYICTEIDEQNMTRDVFLRPETIAKAQSGVEISASILKTGAVGTWKQPFMGFSKLNSDGSLMNPESKAAGMAACGGVVRDRLGNIQIAFSKDLGNFGRRGTILAEAIGLKLGLEAAVTIGIKNLQVETDSRDIFNWIIQGFKNIDHIYRQPIQSCRNILLRHPTWRLFHIPRTANKLAHQLASMGYKADGMVVFQDVKDITNTTDQRKVMQIVKEDKKTMEHW
ncbi:hypothetical protein FNV43_RR04090 [Rhamnella rubrinervis]|uniref:RNase H type-1 domain-containing protein n=1 Tax=Rhamnella rubrinervis TaxID=2594499 RepID=A0A8K0MPQ6_9ROSA|nr:hypothetical protein FNV43_RR04090 [Rhamnella rubrinervis]